MTAEGARFVPFSFEVGQEFSEHTAAVPVLLQVFDGQLTLSAAGRRWSSPAMGLPQARQPLVPGALW